MPLIPAKCTECGGIIQVDKEKDAAVCPHCNTPFIIEKAVNNYIGIAEQYDFEIRAGELIKYNGAAADVVIPDNVTHIKEEAFRDLAGLRSVVIPESVVFIGEYAFAECMSLTDVTIHAGVVFIGKYAFAECINLKSIAIPDSVTSIGDHVFAGCTSLRHIEIPDNIISVKASVFDGCSKLTAINGKPKNEYPAFQTSENQKMKEDVKIKKDIKIRENNEAKSTFNALLFLFLCALFVLLLIFTTDIYK